ncbi:ABC1 kinase family protein [Kitasatospora sp. NPDC004289]
MTFTFLAAVVVGVAVNTALLASGARRLLDTRFSLLRTVIAGTVGQFAAGPVINGLLGRVDPERRPGLAVLYVGLGWAVALLIAMIVLVLWEAFVPAGGTTPLGLLRGLRSRVQRTRRYWQFTRILVRNGLGPELRGRGRASGPADQARLARALSSALEQGGVTFVKLGQVLSTRRDLLPPAFVEELARLQDGAAPVPWAELEPVLRAELGAPVEEVFAAFDREPLASASVAQAHTARLRTGEEVVVKVRRPGTAATVERDLEIVGRLARTVDRRGGWGRSIGVAALAEGFATALREELDFRVEARNMTAVAAAADARDGGEPGPVRVPRPYQDLCGERVLVMERLTGTPLAKAGPLIEQAGLDRRVLARQLLEAVLRQITLDGVFHADPHPGNVLLLTDGSLGLLDFGSVGRLDRELRAALGRLTVALNQADPVGMTDALLEVTTRPDGLDEAALERDLGAFMARHLGPGAAPDVQLFAALFRLVARHRLTVPPEFAAVFRALGTLEGGLGQLAPGFDLVAETRSFGERHLAEALRPASLREAAGDELLALLPMLRRLPRRLDRIAGAMEGGRFGVNVRLLADERDRRTVTGLLHQVLLTVLAATSGVMAALLVGVEGGPTLDGRITVHQFLGYCLLVVASALALRVLVIVFRPHRDQGLR